MSLPKFSVNNRVLVNMMMVVLLVGGGLFAFTLVREMFPESRPNRLNVVALYPGVQPEEIERAVTIKIEEAVRDIEGIEKVDSQIQEGLSVTTLTLYSGVEDVDAVLQEVKNEVDALQDLPDDLEQITFQKLEPMLPVISVAIYGPGSEADLKRAARRLRDDLLLLPGISDVRTSGTREDEISVEVRPDQLIKYNVTFDEVAQAIAQMNLDVSGGELKDARSSVAVRTLGESLRGRDLEDIEVRALPDGRKVHVSDVADVYDTFVQTDLESYFNGEPSVNVVVYKSSDQDVIQIATLVKAYINGKQGAVFDPHRLGDAYAAPWYKKPLALAGSGISWLTSKTIDKMLGRPDPLAVYENSRANPFDHNFQVALHTDLARFVEGRLELMTRNGRTGLLLVMLSLMLFLNWRVAFWAAVGLPVSFLGTFVVMYAFGATINLLTMFGLIIVLGIIVDDAIVIGENIFRHVEEGTPPMRAAVKGAEEVMWPVTVAVLTTIAAFAPMFFVKGQIGDFMSQLPIVVLSALSVSLLEALVILPAHLAHLPSKLERQRQAARVRKQSHLRRLGARFREWQERFVHRTLGGLYERFLRVALKWRYVTLAVAIALLLVVVGMVQGEIVEMVFIQKVDSETVICAVELPVGSTVEQVREQVQRIARHAVEQPEVRNVQTFVGRQYDMTGVGAMPSSDQSHLGQLVVELHPADERETAELRSSEQLLYDFRRFSEKLAGVNSITWEAMSGGPGGKKIHIKVTGPEFQELVAVSAGIKGKLATYQGVFDLDDNHDEGKREVRIALRKAAAPTGITVAALGGHVRSATYGREARRITRNREDVRIMVRYPERFRESVYNIESMWVPTPGGEQQRGWVPMKEVARLTEARTYDIIHRSQQQRSITVFGDVDEESGASTFEILGKIRQAFDEEIKPKHPQVRIEFLGQSEELRKAFSGLFIAFPVALVAIYMLLGGLFRSYVQPLVVMSAIPFGALGAVVGHWVTNNPMTILSGIGMLALTGIVVNDSLVLVDFINRRVRSGMTDFEASIQGAKLRLRAILLTTLTTVAGLTPIMFETSFQAKFLIPMAVTLTFGLIFATALTLVIVPTLNMIFFDFRSLFRRPPLPDHIEDDDSPAAASTGDSSARSERPAAEPAMTDS